MREVPVGAKGEAAETVEFKHTLTFHHAELPPVYSTPDMVRLMETACFMALHPYHEDGEINVGTHINVEHRAATTVGAQVRAEAVFERMEGRFYVMRVTAWDDRQEIGRGTVNRAIVNLAKFMGKFSGAGQ